MVTEVVSVDALERALYVAVSNDSPLEHALLDSGAMSPARLEEELARGDAPVLHGVVADVDLIDRLPTGLCSRLLAVPLRYDARSNTVDLAVVNVFDTHAAEEIAFHLQANVVAVRASLTEVEAALKNRPSYVELAASRPGRRETPASSRRHQETPPPVPVRITKRTPPWGTDVSVMSSLSNDRTSDIPIPLTRRRSIVPGDAPPASILPAEPPPPDDIAALTYARLGGGLSLPDAALVRSKSSSPAPELDRSGEGLRIDALPMAAVEVASSRGISAAPTTDRDGTREAPPASSSRHGDELALPPRTAAATRAGEGPLVAPVPEESMVAIPAPPDTERGLTSVVPAAPASPAISHREEPSTAREAPRPPPVSLRAPSVRPPGSIPPPISVRAPSRRPGPTGSAWPEARPLTKSLPPPDAAHVIAALKTAPDRDAVLAYVLAGARGVARRVALFVAKKGTYVGWSCSPELGNETALVSLSVPQDAPTVLNWAATEGTYLGPLDPSSHGTLLAVMGSTSRDVAAVPIRVSGKTAIVIVADELGDTMIGTKRLEEIARAAGDALLRVVRAGKK